MALQTNRLCTFTAFYGGQQVVFLPVFWRKEKQKEIMMWAAFYRKLEIGIVAASLGRWQPWHPAKVSPETPKKLLRCKLTHGGLSPAGKPDSRVITGRIRPLGTAAVPTSTCSTYAFGQLCREARGLRAHTSAGAIVPRDQIVEAVSKSVSAPHTVGDLDCAFRAQGWWEVDQQGWTFN